MGMRCIENDWIVDKVSEIIEGVRKADIEHKLIIENHERLSSDDLEHVDLRVMLAKFLREQLQLYLSATAPNLEISNTIMQLSIFGLEKKRRAKKGQNSKAILGPEKPSAKKLEKVLKVAAASTEPAIKLNSIKTLGIPVGSKKAAVRPTSSNKIQPPSEKQDVESSNGLQDITTTTEIIPTFWQVCTTAVAQESAFKTNANHVYNTVIAMRNNTYPTNINDIAYPIVLKI